MKSSRHIQQIENISNLLCARTEQELQRKKAEEHIKRIEGKEVWVDHFTSVLGRECFFLPIGLLPFWGDFWALECLKSAQKP